MFKQENLSNKMTSIVYVLLYIHTDNPEYSEILGVFNTKDKAVDELLERANYRKNKNGELTQYKEKTEGMKKVARISPWSFFPPIGLCPRICFINCRLTAANKIERIRTAR